MSKDIKENLELIEKIDQAINFAIEKNESDLEKSIKSTIAGLGLVAGLGMNPSMLDTPKEAPAQQQESQKSSFAKFGTQPEDHFLHNIMQVETSGGKNLNHPKISYGMHKGSKAVGKFALMPHTIKEIAKRYNMQGKSHPEIDAIHDMPTNQVSGYISKNPHVELELARTLANHVIKKHGGDLKKAAYGWKYGHNLNSKDINKTKLKHDPYLNNFSSLSKGKSVVGLIPASAAFGDPRSVASVVKSEDLKKDEDQQQASAPAPKQLTGPVETVKPQTQQAPKVKINPEHGLQIANAYDQMKHDPNHPDVKAAYGALINETKGQFKDLMKKGLKISKIKEGMENPYKTSKDMHKDIEENNHLWYFPTEQGYGSGEQVKDHPMLQPTEFKHGGQPMLANDMFRVVHDINGHYLGGKSAFGPTGEHQAYLTHKQMFSPLANKALFTETAGQNNWVNWSQSHGEKNRKDPKNTTFAEQKAGLMPDNIINKDWHV